MADRPTEPSDPTDPSATPERGRSLGEILEELAMLSHAQQGEASEMRSAVSELSRSLARLFEMIRTDRREQQARIAELERDLRAAHEQLRALGAEPAVAPAPNDFDQLRAAAERLRVRTEQLVRDAGRPEAPITPTVDASAGAVDASAAPAEGSALEAPAAPDDATAADGASISEEPEGDGPPSPVEESEPADLAPILQIVPPALTVASDDADLAVESELPLAAALGDGSTGAVVDPASGDQDIDEGSADEAVAVAASAPVPAPAVPAAAPRPEPIPIGPRAARPRGLRPRRRRIDARKLRDVEPTAALGSMVGAIQQLWTAGCPLDLVIAFTDGGAVRVSGGDRSPLRVEDVEPGTPARCTVTATRRQLVPLFGRLDLTDEESAPLIHGSRRDADLLVGWIDRAQRLSAQPL